ncbi:MAG: glycosyltransferase [Hyphomicrobiales bacterium]|nr:glycosyltransferase [Hyphomicrobiales bacterium]
MSIGIVIPAYRSADTLGRTIRSCLPHVDPRNIVVVLDGPDDDAEKAAREASRGSRILVMPQNCGAPVCRNEGLALLDTDYVMFLDADDYIEGPLLAGASRIAHDVQADIVLSPFCFEMPDGSRRAFDPKTRYAAFDRDAIVAQWLIGGYTPPCAVVWRTKFVRDIGAWDETLAKNQDGDIMYRALLLGAQVAGSSEGMGVYVQSEDPSRITRRNTRKTLTSQLTVLDRVRADLPKMLRPPVCELALAYYGLAKLAYDGEVDDIGRRAETLSRRLGLEGQRGTPAHVVVASCIGLRGKQRLVNFVRRSVETLAPSAA